jgi:hypothetical protein
MRVRLSMLLIVLPIATIFSMLTLYIVGSWIRFILFGFEILAMMISFFLLTSNWSVPFRNYQTMQLNKLSSKFYRESLPSLMLIGMSTTLLVLILFNIEGGMSQLFFAMIVGGFLVGYAILNTLGIRKYFTTIEFCLISFLVSISFTGLSYFMFKLTGSAEMMTSISFVIIGVLSLLITSVTEDSNGAARRLRSLTRPLDAFAITSCIGFYLIFVALVYPEAASVVGTDISRHFSYSAVLLRTPDLYSGPSYFLFHSFQGTVFQLSGGNQPVFTFLTFFVFINIFVPLSLYAASKRLLEAIDTRIPGLAVIFYTFLSNLSFLYFIALYVVKPVQGGSEYFLIIREVAEKSYFSIINFFQPFSFVGPFTISIIGVLILLFIIRNGSIPKYRYIGLISFLTASCGLIHAPEIAILVLLISFFSITGLKAFPRISQTLIGMSIGLSISALVFVTLYITVLKENVLASPILLATFLLPAAVSTIAFILNHRSIVSNFIRSQKSLQRFRRSIRPSILEVSVFVIVILYLIGIAFWFFLDGFKTSDIYRDIGAIPSFLFPVMLGVVGLLAIFSIREIRHQASSGALPFLLFGILLLFVIGKVISYININFYDLPYWEKRIPGLIFIFASMLAPIVVIKFSEHILGKRRNASISTIILTSVLASIILLGFSSMALQVEYWYIRAKGEQKLGMQESDAVSTLQKVIDKQNSSVTISPSDYSRHVVTFAAPTYQFSKPDIVFSSRSPEVPLMILGGLPYDRIYIYIHDRDLDILDGYPTSWFSNYLLPSLPTLYSSKEVNIYNATGLKSPLSNSETAIIKPSYQISNNWLHSYDAVSKSIKNYTEILDQDTSSFTEFADLVLIEDPISPFNYHLDLTSKNASQDFWRTKGIWEHGKEGLTGIGNYSDTSADRNMLISDFIFDDNNNMTLSTLFKINNQALNTKLNTQVAFVLSWVNQTNFDMAGVTLKDRDVYVYFATIRNSEMTLYPRFPYTPPLFTGLEWKGGSVFNMTVTTSGDAEHLLINGTEFLSRTNTNSSSGFIGISTSGPNDITFKQFAISTGMNSPRSYPDYQHYVSGGGNLTVYNTNGYGSIFDMLNNSRSQLMKGSLTYPHNLTVTNAKLGLGNIKYVDVHPILTDVLNSEIEKNSFLESVMAPTLNEDSELVNRNSREIPMFFENLRAEGDTFVNTSFIGFPDGIDGKVVGIMTSDNKDALSLGTNLTSLKLFGYDAATIRSDSLAFLRKGGMYSDVILGGHQTVSLAFNRDTSMQLGTSNGSHFNYENVTFVALEINQPLEVMTRTPVISLEGNIQFVNLHAARLTGIDGEDVAFEGRITFGVPASDIYTLTENVSYTGTFSTPPINYDEFSILTSSLYLLGLDSQQQKVIVLFVIPFILAAIFLLYRRI